MDIFKGIIFSDVVPKAKTDHLKHLGKEFIGLFSPSGLVSIAKFFMKLLTGKIEVVVIEYNMLAYLLIFHYLTSHHNISYIYIYIYIYILYSNLF